MRICNLQALRALAALGVVLYHVNHKASLNVGNLTPAASLDVFSFGECGVDLFFVISGFIMVFITPRRIDSAAGYIRFMYQRFTRIFPPYWLITLPMTLIYLLDPGIFWRDLTDHADLFGSLFLLPQRSYPLLLAAWTLIHEFYFYLVISFALMFAAPGRWIFGFVWAGAVLIGYACIQRSPLQDHPLLLLIFSPFSLTFLLGYFIGLAYSRLVSLPPGFQVALLLLGLILLPVLKFTFSPHAFPGTYPHNNSLPRFFIFGIPFGLIVAGAVSLEKRISLSHRSIQLLGDSSYSLYLVHLPLISLYYSVIVYFHLNHSSWIVAMVAVAGCVLAGVVYHCFAERPMMRLARNAVKKEPEPAGAKPTADVKLS